MLRSGPYESSHMSEIRIRPACNNDIPALLELLEIASYGFVKHVFTVLSEPEADVDDVVASRMTDPASHLALSKTKVAEIDGHVAGFVVLEAQSDPADPVSDDTPALLRPLLDLESMAPGTTVVSFIATFPAMRGRGVGRFLMDHAEQSRGPKGMCLTVHDQNSDARKLYLGLGYREVARRDIVKQGWGSPASEWILMTKA